MIRNRYFKQTLGVPAEILIAQSLYTAGTAVVGVPATVDVPVTIAGSPTAADTITATVDGIDYTYAVPVSGTTQQAHDGILAILQAAGVVQGFTVVTHSGTTSSSYKLSWGLGTAGNGKVVSLAKVGSTFTVAGPYTVAGGVETVSAFGADYKAFVTASAAGKLGIFWDEVNSPSVDPGELSNPANIALGRKYFYAVKDQNNMVKRTSAIRLNDIKSKVKAPYTAGQADIWTVTAGAGTYTNGQYIHIKILDTTLNVPYPFFEYYAIVSGGTSNASMTAIAAAINAETEDPMVTAAAVNDVLTITGIYNSRTFKVVAYLETVTGATTDASNFVLVNTQKAVEERGTYADMLELAKYQTIAEGGINYAPEGQNVSEWQVNYNNVVSGVNYGQLIIGQVRWEKGETRNYDKKLYTIIALPTASLNALAAY